jgi:hypothetical protein
VTIARPPTCGQFGHSTTIGTTTTIAPPAQGPGTPRRVPRHAAERQTGSLKQGKLSPD